MGSNNSKKIVFLLITFFILVVLGSANALNAVKSNQEERMLNQQYAYFTGLIGDILYENNSDISCSFTESGAIINSGCKNFYKLLLQKLRIKKYCRKDAYSQHCVPVYKSYSTDKTCAGFSREMINNYDDAVLLYNNILLIIANDEKEARFPRFAIDINGLSGPNVPGKDLFSFTVMKNNSGGYFIDPDFTQCLPVENKNKDKTD